MSAAGMLTLEQLASLSRSGEIDTVLVVFTDHYGRFMGKRFDAGFFLEHAVRARHPRLRLPADRGHGDGPGPRLSLRQLGARLRRLSSGARPGDAAHRPAGSTGPRWCSATCRARRRHEPVAVGAALDPAAADRARGRAWASRAMAGSELEYYLFRDSLPRGGGARLPRARAAGWYLEDYHVAAGHARGAFNGAVRRHLRRSGVPVENSKGEWGLGQHELNVRYADVLDDGRPPRASTSSASRRSPTSMGLSVTFMAKFAADQAGSSCHST